MSAKSVSINISLNPPPANLVRFIVFRYGVKGEKRLPIWVAPSEGLNIVGCESVGISWY